MVQRACTAGVVLAVVAACVASACSLALPLSGYAGSADASEEPVSGEDAGIVALPDGSTVDGDGGDASDLIFADEFTGAGLGADWAVLGDGAWTAGGGEVTQEDQDSNLAAIVVPRFAELRDYRVMARMRHRQSAGTGGAMEIAFRVDMSGTNPMYICNWEPKSRLFILMRSLNGVAGVPLVEFTVAEPPGYTPDMPVTMEVIVKGDAISCHLLEIPAAVATVTDATLARGTFGLKTYALSASFDYLRVYAVR